MSIKNLSLLMIVVFSLLVLVSGFLAFSSIGVNFSDVSNIKYNNKSLANGTSKTYNLNNFSQIGRAHV